MAELIFALLSLTAVFALAMNRAPLRAWALAVALFTFALQIGLGSGHLHAPVFNFWAVLGWLAAAGLFALTFPRIKRDYVVLPAYRALKGAMPTISDTEQEALDAGTVGWDAELFSGKPDWAKLLGVRKPTLTRRGAGLPRRAGRQLCSHDRRLGHPPQARRHAARGLGLLKEQGFLGMLIAKEHGGLGFSAQAQSLVVGKIASRSSRRRHHRHGAQLARAGRAAREIRHARAEGEISRRGSPRGRKSRASR